MKTDFCNQNALSLASERHFTLPVLGNRIQEMIPQLPWSIALFRSVLRFKPFDGNCLYRRSWQSTNKAVTKDLTINPNFSWQWLKKASWYRFWKSKRFLTYWPEGMHLSIKTKFTTWHCATQCSIRWQLWNGNKAALDMLKHLMGSLSRKCGDRLL